MTRIARRHALMMLAGTLAATRTSPASAQAYPTHNIRLIVPFAPGGADDLIGRAAADGMAKDLGKAVVVENISAGGGVLGTSTVKNAPSDGYTLGVSSSSSFGTSPVVTKDLPYDVLTDFTLITKLAAVPMVIVVNPAFPAKSYAEFVSVIQANPGKYSYASGGTGSLGNFGMEYVKYLSKLDIVHIPYRGAGPAQIDVLSGQVPILIENLSSALPLIKDGRLVPIVISFDQRNPDIPNVPIFADLGMPEVKLDGWVGLFGPRGLSADIVRTLGTSAARAVQTPEMRQRLDAAGYFVRTDSPQELTDEVRANVARWREVAKVANLTFE